MDKELSGTTTGLRSAADEILSQLKAIQDMKSQADPDEQDLAQKTKMVKDDLAAFEKRFDAAGQKIGGMIKSKVSSFLPL